MPENHSRANRDVQFDTRSTGNHRQDPPKLWHGNRIAPSSPQAGEAVTATVTAGIDVSIHQMVIRYTLDGTLPDASSAAIPLALTTPRWDVSAGGYVEDWSATIPGQDNGVLVHYRIQALTDLGIELWADSGDGSGDAGLFGYEVGQGTPPSWLRQAVIYEVSVDSFAPDPGKTFRQHDARDESWGGTFKGLTAHLDHITDLGATAICLTPIFSPRQNDATSCTEIDPNLGSEHDLISLIETAHSQNLRVLMGLPTGKPMTDAALYWLDRGVDGFRLSDSDKLSPAFLAGFRRMLRAVKPDVTIIGEVNERADTMASFNGRLDGTVDYLLQQQLHAFIALDQTNAADFWRFLSRHLAWMPANLTLPSVLDKPNMNRFLWSAQSDKRRLKLAALIQFALPHPPIIHYGTEVGLDEDPVVGQPGDSHRMEGSHPPMRWGANQDRDLRSFYRALVFWRKSQHIHVNSPAHVYAGDNGLLCFRTGEWFVVINRSGEDTAIDFQEHGEVWLALGTEFDVQLHGSAIQLPPMSGAILRG